MTTMPPDAARGVLIVGSGLAGLATALGVAKRDPALPITLVTLAEPGEAASSAWAQGGIAAALGDNDSPERHLADTLAAGAGIVDEEAARIVTGTIPGRVKNLADLGIPFDRAENGDFAMGREAAHSRARIAKVTGDQAGAAVTQGLVRAAKAHPSIHLLRGHAVVDLLKDDGRICGVLAITKDGTPVALPAAHVVLATGGAAGLYAVSTTPLGLLGTGLGLAARAGAIIADAEFVQFHPTGMLLGQDPTPLATEALRGEGAVLVNESGDRFMRAVHGDAELAPRDVVARGVHQQIQRGHKVFLDARKAISHAFKTEFPTVYGLCMTAGLDPEQDPIPVGPAAHYHMGGIACGMNGRSSLDGLWACGEVASTGLHGANRLASNSLAEALVMGELVAASILEASEPPLLSAFESTHSLVPTLPQPGAVIRLRHAMSEQVGLVRTKAGLSKAARIITELDESCESLSLANSLAAATMIVSAASLRQESRGSHFRSDYPVASENWRHRSSMTFGEAQVQLRGLTRNAQQPHTKVAYDFA
jgi:L-aspartate oxidase